MARKPPARHGAGPNPARLLRAALAPVRRLRGKRRNARASRRAATPTLRLRRKPRHVPVFWQRIDAGLAPLFAASQPDLDRRGILRLQQLVLAARRIPYLADANGHLYVPPLHTRQARFELLAYTRENRPLPPTLPPPGYHNAPWMIAALCALVVWYGVVEHWWPGTDALPPVTAWKQLGSLNVFQIVYTGEWWRCLTALTLHSDSEHLLANVVFGMPFMVMLGRRVGAGPAILLTVLAGALGNACNALYRPYAHDSLGFSTALFGVVGLLAGLFAVRTTGKGRVLLPLAAGVGILASLGTGDIEGRVDYAAHIFGLLAGMALGTAYGKLLQYVFAPGRFWRGVCGFLAALLLWGAWRMAMR